MHQYSGWVRWTRALYQYRLWSKPIFSRRNELPLKAHWGHTHRFISWGEYPGGCPPLWTGDCRRTPGRTCPLGPAVSPRRRQSARRPRGHPGTGRQLRRTRSGKSCRTAIFEDALFSLGDSSPHTLRPHTAIVKPRTAILAESWHLLRRITKQMRRQAQAFG